MSRIKDYVIELQEQEAEENRVFWSSYRSRVVDNISIAPFSWITEHHGVVDDKQETDLLTSK